MFKKIKVWLIRRRFHKEIEKASDGEVELDAALKAGAKELAQAAREARKRNKLFEQRRLIKEVEDEQDDAEDYLDDEDEQDDAEVGGFNPERELLRIVEPLLRQKLGIPVGVPLPSKFEQYNRAVSNEPDAAESIIRDVAHQKIDELTDEQILELTKKFRK